MTTHILMPAVPGTREPAKLTKWLVGEGQAIRAGDVVAEIESGTMTMEVEAADEGLIGAILVPAGTAGVGVGTPLAEVVTARAGQTSGGEATDAAPAPPPSDAPSIAASEAGVDASASAPADNDVPVPAVPPPASVSIGPQIATIREALRQALAEEMRRDQDVVLIGEHVVQPAGALAVTHGLADDFGAGRVLNAPSTGEAVMGLAAGSAMAGLKPVLALPSWSHALAVLEHLVQSAAKAHYATGGKLEVPLVLRGPDGAAKRAGAQANQSLAAWLAHVPGLKVVAPATASDAKGLLKSAIRDRGPVCVLEHEGLYDIEGEVPPGDDLVPIGQARIAREGRDVTLVAYGRAVLLAMEAAATLALAGVDAEVIDLRSLRPLDIETVLASVRKTHRIVTVEEGWPVASIGSHVCAEVASRAFDDLDAPPARVNGADVPMPYAANLERLALLDVDAVVAAVKAVCYV